MTRMLPITSLLAAALMTAACDVPKNEEQPADVQKLNKPVVPGGSFTDLPPLEPPEAERRQPEPQP